MTRRVWLDTDIIFNRVGGDVDDGLALMVLLQNPEVEIVGISLNIEVDNGAAVTQRFLDYYARYPIPVYKGADRAGQSLAEDNDAVQALADALMHQSFTILALGSATNLAALIDHYPQVTGNIESVVFCAGRTPGAVFNAKGSDIGLPDANFDNDPVSMQRVLKSGVHVLLAGFQATEGVYLQHEDINQIRRRGRRGDFWVYRRLLIWLLGWRVRLGVTGFIPFDACTVGAWLWPEYYTIDRNLGVDISVRDNDAPDFKDVAHKPYLEVSPTFPGPVRVDFARRVRPQFKSRLMQSLLARPPVDV